MEHVVVVDRVGVPVATLPKQAAHSTTTPLHLAFSCHVVRPDGQVLLTQRALSKSTWPGAWTNACCGHPQLGEDLGDAVERRLGEELGLRLVRLAVAVPDFAYRAEMADGTVEHELCPVVVAEVDGCCRPDPDEVADVRWMTWAQLRQRAAGEPASLSPWSVAQVDALGRLAPDLHRWLEDATPPRQPTRPPRPPSSSVDPVAPVLAPLDQLLEPFLDRKARNHAAIDPRLGDLTDAVASLVLAGGKRLRPAFVHWGHRAVGGGDDAAVLHLAAAIEVVHAFALLHDDVMDRSTLRRGRPAAHVTLGARHRATGSVGDSAWFGTSAAILAGDLAHVWADDLLEAAPMGTEAVSRVREVLRVLREEVVAGQYLDLLLAGDPRADEAAALEVALLKSARYSVSRPLQLGAALATPEPVPALQAYGDPIGIAFQLRDDVLGLFGDPRGTGKGNADDLREGKRTVLVLRALRLADDRGRRVLRAALGDPDLDEVRADEAREVVASSGALASVEIRIRAEHDRALESLDAVPAPARDALVALADRAVRRVR